MAAKNVPWWRKILNGALRGLRAGVAALLRPVKDKPADEPANTIESREEAALTEQPPKPAPQPVSVAAEMGETVTPEVQAPEAAPLPEPNAINEPVSEAASEPEPEPAVGAIEEQVAEKAAEDVIDPPKPAAESTPESVAEPPGSPADLIAEAAAEALPPDPELAAQEEQLLVAPAVEQPEPEPVEPAAEEEQDARKPEEPEIEAGKSISELEPVEVATDAVLPAGQEITEEAVEPASTEAIAEEPETPQAPVHCEEPAFPAGTIEETNLAPEIETAETASEPDLGIALEAAAEEEAGAERDAPQATEIAATEVAQEELASEPEAEPVPAAEVERPERENSTEDASSKAAEEFVPEPVSDDATPEPEEPEPAPEPVAEQALTEAVEPQAASEPVKPVPAALPQEATPPPAPGPQPSTAPAQAKPPAAAPEPPQPIKREEGPENSPFSVMVSQVYEGPFDLLLDLIRKQDIDIYDIPIAKITAQFLAYVNQLRASDMDVAGEFIYTASLLIHIKSKMLLPREPHGLDDAPEDPRRELVERLLEHERFKNAAQMLQQKQMLEAATWTNPGVREFMDDAGAEPEIAADTVDLVRIFREIIERARNRPIINVEEDTVTVGQMIQFLSRRLTMEDKPIALRRLLSHTKSERALIAMFLALLELVRLQAILLRQDRHFSEIFIKKNAGFEAVMDQGLVRDDWQ